MGCFSYMCQVCGNPIVSDSERGQKCILYLLKDGKVIEKMEGEYDSYGRVFDENGESIEWDTPWGEIVELHFNHKNNDGIAAFHYNCYKKFDHIDPQTISDDDPEQGWGSFYKQKTPYKGGRKIEIHGTGNILSFLIDTEEKRKVKEVLDVMTQKFTSGNEIPVPQNTITRKEWNIIRPILEKELK